MCPNCWQRYQFFNTLYKLFSEAIQNNEYETIPKHRISRCLLGSRLWNSKPTPQVFNWVCVDQWNLNRLFVIDSVVMNHQMNVPTRVVIFWQR